MVCDGFADCSDHADEPATCKSDCQDNEDFWCAADSSCLSSYAVCDGYQDCSDGADEPDDCAQLCVARAGAAWCLADQFCLDEYDLCDGQNDCSDGSDEPADCQTRCEARDGGLWCAPDALCYYEAQLCDGKADCSDGSDEPADCADLCLEGDRFWCASDSKCLNSWDVCDADPDCSDQSDETSCECLGNDFQCEELTFRYCVFDSQAQTKVWQQFECPVKCSSEIGCYECDPGAIGCVSGDVATCDQNGYWAVTEACESQTCIDNVCTGVCHAGEYRCDGYTATACDDTGQWSSTTEDCAWGCLPDTGCAIDYQDCVITCADPDCDPANCACSNYTSTCTPRSCSAETDCGTLGTCDTTDAAHPVCAVK
jgi:hypothetical protein